MYSNFLTKCYRSIICVVNEFSSIYLCPTKLFENEVVGEHDGMLKIKIKAPADSGKAKKTVELDVDEMPVDLEELLASIQ